MRPHLASVLGTICPEGAHLTLPADLTGTRGAPISDPARFGVLLNTCRVGVGDRRSGAVSRYACAEGANLDNRRASGPPGSGGRG